MPDNIERPTRAQHLIAVGLLGTVFLLLARAVLSIPMAETGVSAAIQDNIDVSGVINPVTAVLLNFRAWDTLLEIAVLVLAIIGVLSLLRDGVLVSARMAPKADPVLSLLTRILVPLMILVAGYLLWAGEKAPGGAFQAGSILGAAGVLISLSGHVRPGWLSPLIVKVIIAVGFVVFLVAAVIPMFFDKNLLEYPLNLAKTLIIVIETWLTLSIGMILVTMFLSSAAPLRDEFDGSDPL